MIQVLSELEEAELREDREKLAAENKDGEENKFALDIIRRGEIHVTFCILSNKYFNCHFLIGRSLYQWWPLVNS